METNALQNSIIRKVLKTDNHQLLDSLNQLLTISDNHESHRLSGHDKSKISQSRTDYLSGEAIPNEILFYQNDQWMRE